MAPGRFFGNDAPDFFSSEVDHAAGDVNFRPEINVIQLFLLRQEGCGKVS
jgi:hypothetical protein